MNNVYTQKVEVRLNIIPIIAGEEYSIRESFAPNLIDQRDTMVNQFVGMTDVEFDYSEFEDTRWNLIKSEESQS